MGWTTTCHDTRRALLAELRADFSGPTWRILGEASTGYCLRWWVALEHVREDGTVSRFVGLYLLSRPSRPSPWDYGIRGWGYKDMDEGCGPYHYDCPLRLLDLTGPDDDPIRGEWARGWRAKVRAYHAERRASTHGAPSFKRGDRVTLWGREYQVETAPSGRNRCYRVRQGFRVFRVRQSHVPFMQPVKVAPEAAAAAG